jgi:hypothetical protein
MKFLVQRILTGLEDRYEKEKDLRKKMHLAEKCADTFSRLKRNEQSKNYYLKQVKEKEFEILIFNLKKNEFYLVKTCTRIESS